MTKLGSESHLSLRGVVTLTEPLGFTGSVARIRASYSHGWNCPRAFNYPGVVEQENNDSLSFVCCFQALMFGSGVSPKLGMDPFWLELLFVNPAGSCPVP